MEMVLSRISAPDWVNSHSTLPLEVKKGSGCCCESSEDEAAADDQNLSKIQVSEIQQRNWVLLGARGEGHYKHITYPKYNISKYL